MILNEMIHDTRNNETIKRKQKTNTFSLKKSDRPISNLTIYIKRKHNSEDEGFIRPIMIDTHL